MSRRSFRDKNVRKLLRIGNRSVAVTLPLEILDALGWRRNQKVVVKKRGKSIMISDWPAYVPFGASADKLAKKKTK